MPWKTRAICFLSCVPTTGSCPGLPAIHHVASSDIMSSAPATSPAVKHARRSCAIFLFSAKPNGSSSSSSHPDEHTAPVQGSHRHQPRGDEDQREEERARGGTRPAREAVSIQNLAQRPSRPGGLRRSEEAGG